MNNDVCLADWRCSERIAVLTINSPPVNALSTEVRRALVDAVTRLRQDDSADVLVLHCAGRTFFPGADIREFSQPPQLPSLPDVIDAIEQSSKPIVAAIHGTALGGGLEVALGCHARIATDTAQFGMPEVKLGLIPGAGGTQRLPRLVGLARALQMIIEAEPISAADALACGLIDGLVADTADLLRAATDLAHRISKQPLRRTAALVAPAPEHAIFEHWEARTQRRFKHQAAPAAALQAVHDGLALPVGAALAYERRLFVALREGDQSRALRYLYTAEREAARVPGVEQSTPVIPVRSIAIVGAGTMGTGIATSFLSAGFPVVLLERDTGALERGVATIGALMERSVKGGRLSREAASTSLAHLTPTLADEALHAADLVVEAAYEDLKVKQSIFRRLDAVVHEGAILATNTSYLDVDEIAAVTRRPESVVGMHFFSPAHIMRLIEVVRGAVTSPSTLATILQLTRRLGKLAVVARVGPGFIGNRMLAVRRQACDLMMLQGASPYDIDRVAEEFGFPMGPFRVSDLAGLDLGWTAETSTGATVRERLCELGRRGEKAGAGFYDYKDGQGPMPSPIVEELIRAMARAQQIEPRPWPDPAILDRMLTPMLTEGRAIVDEGVALRPSDIDVVWVHGYGWPRWRGGPMYYADQVARMTGIAP
jgi:3-hydroxyacyl-CoA dehydrogenase